MPKPIIGICQIQFDGHTWFPSLSAGVDSFLNHKDIVTDLTTKDEASLVGEYKRSDNWLESYRYDFRKYFVRGIA